MHTRILLVENDEALADAVSTLLRMEGVQVEVLHDGRGAVGTVAHSRPDVVVLDVSLGELDGIAVARALRDAWPELPIIFATGNAESDNVRQIERDSRTIVMEKPFTIEMLINMINAATLR
jgi:DNA-binding response OmpR family regulator